jgi:hypothetical protein
MTPPFVGFLPLACSGSCGTTGGWAPAGVSGLWGGCSSASANSSSVGHYNCLINSNNQVKHKLSTQGSLLFQR